MKTGHFLPFVGLVAIGALFPRPAFSDSYLETFVGPVPSPLEETAPSYQLPDNPHPTADELISGLQAILAKQPDAVDVSYQLGLAYAAKGQQILAEQTLKAAVALNPHQVEAWNNLGANLRDQGKLDEAINAFKSALQEDPRNENAWHGLALVLLELSRLDESGTALAEGFKVAPNSAGLWNCLGLLRVKQSQFKEAADAFERAAEISPELAGAWCNLGFAQSRSNEPDKALSNLLKAVGIDDQLTQAWNDLAEIYEKEKMLGKCDEATRHSLQVTPNQPALWESLGHHAYLRFRWEDCVEAYSQAIDRMGMQNAVAMGEYALGAAHVGHFDDADKIINAALQLEPDNSELWVSIGNVRLLQKREEDGFGAFRRALNADPQNVDAWCALGFFYQQFHDPDHKGATLGLDAYKKATEIDPNCGEAWNGMAVISIKLGRLDDAGTDLAEGFKVAPDLPVLWDSLGLLRLNQSQFDKAAAAFKQSTTIDPDYAIGWYNLGLAQGKLNDLDEAAASFHRCLDLNPDMLAARNALAELFEKKGQLSKSDEALHQSLALAPNQPVPMAVLAHHLFLLGKWEEAVGEYSQAVDRMGLKNADVISEYGEAAAHIGHFEDAEKLIGEAQVLDPKSSMVWDHLGQLRLLQQRNKEATDAFQKALQIDPKNALAWVGMGLENQVQSKFDDSITCFQKCIDYFPDNVVAWEGMGYSNQQLGKRPEAAQAYRKALYFNPSLPLCWKGLAVTSDDNQEIEKAASQAIASDPHDLASLSVLGVVQRRLNQGPESESTWRSVLAICDTKAPYWDELGNTLVLEKKYGDAIAAYNKAITLSGELPPRVQALYWAGLATAHMDNIHLAGATEWQPAADALNKAVALDPTVPGTWYYLGVCEKALGHMDLAQAAIAKVNALGRDSKVDLSSLPITPAGGETNSEDAASQGKALIQKGQFKEALAVLWPDLQKKPDDDKVQEERSLTILALLMNHRMDQALELAQKATVNHPDQAVPWFDLGQVLLALHHNDEALPPLTKATEIDPKLSSAWLSLGQCYVQMKEFDQAISSFTKAIDSDSKKRVAWEDLFFCYPGNLPGCQGKIEELLQAHPDEANGWEVLGLCYGRQKEFGQAIGPFIKAINLDPANDTAWEGLNQSYHAQNDLPGLQAKLGELLQAHPDAAMGWLVSAHLQNTQGTTDAALSSLQKAVDLNPTDAKIWNGIGVEYATANQPDQAIKAETQALQLNPAYDEAWNNLGYTLLRQGKTDQAIDAFKKALQVNPRHQRALVNLVTAYGKENQWSLAKDTCDQLAQINPDLAAKLSQSFPSSTTTPSLPDSASLIPPATGSQPPPATGATPPPAP
ncbi:MAG: tetratricopeptide repeat protein [Methylacidiphilales bacterium]|nr:tetratricopeptide repeat protein [Candidatus Methylacidiphilales bacterium]